MKDKILNRVIVTKFAIGMCHMQVCAIDDATDVEILEVCNQQNPAGTQNGWAVVCRNTEPDELWGNTVPIKCKKCNDRTHFLVAC